MTTESALALENIDCTFVSREGAQRYTAVRGATLRVAQGEFVSVVGPRLRKSTLLNVAAGLLQPSAGSVTVWRAAEGINAPGRLHVPADALMSGATP
jgi:NitT/TauT family transport system ATP-binding protein